MKKLDNFIRGMAALFGYQEDHADIINKSVDDAIAEDWQAVGNDMRTVLYEESTAEGPQLGLNPRVRRDT